MAKPKTPSKPSKADLLIEEAVRSIEEQEAKGTEDSSEEKDTKGSIAQIDLQQYVDKEAYLRLAADFENFRRRAIKERTEAERIGKEKALRSFLEIFDNLERGLHQAKDDQGPLADGMRMILSQAETWLKQEGLERIPSVGQIFNPQVHEAVSQIENPQIPTGQIVEELKRGYQWSDRLLRPAAVIVCKNPEIVNTPSGEN